MVDETLIQTLNDSIRGKIILPGDPDYEGSRQVFNGMINKHPGIIARCADTADVMAAINFGRENDLEIAVRGGGHSGPGLGVCDDGLVVDLSEMNGVRVDPNSKTVRVEPGARWRDVDHATHAFGMATVSGTISNTGIGGLALGGGHGYLTRKYGMTADNLLAADVVLADGQFVQANESENPDLFWALKGGGGNFGVVTSFLFQLHPVRDIFGGVTFWPMDQAEAVLRWYQEFITTASEDIYGFFAFLIVPPAPEFPKELHGRNLCGVVWCYTGPEKQAEKVFEPIRAFGPPIFEHLGQMPYTKLQTMFDPLYPPGIQLYWKGDFVRELTDEAIVQHLKFGSKIPTPLSIMHLYPINGAVQRIDQKDTAFPFRDATWSMLILGADPDPANRDKITNWARDYWKALRPHSAEGGYLNFMMEEGEDRIRATYGDNYDRLVSIKNRYDPENLFHHNHNISPTV